VLFNGFKPLFTALDPEQVNKLSFEIVQVLQGQGGTVRDLLASTSSLANTVADRDAVVGQLIDNLNVVLDTVNEGDQRVGELVSSLQALVSGLSQDRESIGDAIVSINDLTRTTAGFLEDVRPPLKDDIAALGDLADNLNRNEEVVDEYLRILPRKLNTISRAGSYASWFNFYLCDIEGLNLRLELPGLPEQVIELPAEQQRIEIGSRTRCNADPDQDGITDIEDLPRGGAVSLAPLSRLTDLAGGTDPAVAPASVDLPLVVGN
jgi:phospholipid/cholesterol/gamma-HCH transport system substrate-binding protein